MAGMALKVKAEVEHYRSRNIFGLLVWQLNEVRACMRPDRIVNFLYAALRCAVLRCAVLCCAVLCCAALRCAVLCVVERCGTTQERPGPPDAWLYATRRRQAMHSGVRCRVFAPRAATGCKGQRWRGNERGGTAAVSARLIFWKERS